MIVHLCGICGFTGGADPAILQKMTQRLWHRGPDDDGLYYDGAVNLGMRRLAIVDVETGKQPQFNEDRSLVGGGNFGTAVAHTLGYRDLLLKYGPERQQLFVQFVVSDLNAHEVEQFTAFWSQAGVNVKIRPKVSWAGLVEAHNLQANATLERRPCYWLMQTINICADGEVALCAVDVHCRVKSGNAREHTIKELWHGKLKEYRRLHKEGCFGALPEMCRECPDWQSGYADYVHSQPQAQTGCP